MLNDLHTRSDLFSIMALKNAAQKAEQAQEKVQDITAKEER